MFASSDVNDERKSRYGGGPHGLGKYIFFKTTYPLISRHGSLSFSIVGV